MSENVLIYLNIQSIVKNLPHVEVLVQNRKPKLVICSETCATPDILDSEIKIDGYNLIRCDSHSRHTGGTLIYIKENIKFVTKLQKCYENNVWCLAIEVLQDELKGIYCVIYHSPSTSDAKCLEFLSNICDILVNLLKTCVVIGDFNIDMTSNTRYSIKLEQLMQSVGLRQIVNFYTRVTNTSNTLIDLIFTNEDRFLSKCLMNDKVSDHETIELKLSRAVQIVETSNKTVISWKNYNKINLQYLINTVEWGPFFFLTLNEKLDYVCVVLNSAVNQLVLYKTVKCNVKNPWYTNELRQLKKEENYLNYKANLTMIRDDFNQYKIARNIYKHKVTETKNLYCQHKIQAAGRDQRKMWKCLKNVIDVKEISKPNSVVFDGVVCTDDMDIASKFNKYFIESVNEIYNSIPINVNTNMLSTNTVNNVFSFECINVEYLMNIVNKFKNKANKGDLITAQVLKDSMDVVGFFFVDIINQSLNTGYVPNAWKLSIIVPIPKVKNTKEHSEYRPVNVLPIHEKLIERVVHKQMLHYLEENNILFFAQSGFRHGHSCETSINYLLATWKAEIEKGNFVIAVFLDFKRAFETIDRDILLLKMKRMGFSDMTINWFQDYLHQRYQKTTFNSSTSEKRLNNIGVPQGSVLGPLLFILYVNDIAVNLEYCTVNLFADDTLLSISSKSPSDAYLKMNSDLTKLSKWLKQNKLKLNIKKTKYMLIGGRKNLGEGYTVNIDGEVIEKVSNMKYLGVIIDDKLTFKEHACYISKKLSSKIGVMYRASKKLTYSAKLTVYRSFILPHFQYCSTVLFLCNECDLQKLQVQQNKVMRLILKCKRETNVKGMLTTLNWLSVRQLIYFNVLLLIYKMQNDLLPNYLCSNLLYIHQCHNLNTRNKNKFKLPNFKKRLSKNNVFYKGLKMYNELPSNLIECSINVFKEKLKVYVKTQFNV